MHREHRKLLRDSYVSYVNNMYHALFKIYSTLCAFAIFFYICIHKLSPLLHNMFYLLSIADSRKQLLYPRHSAVNRATHAIHTVHWNAFVEITLKNSETPEFVCECTCIYFIITNLY